MTHRIRLLTFAVAAGAIFAAPATALGQTRLVANVGLNDEMVISLTNASGARVTDIPAGTYEIEVNDHSEHHNFHLTGPGVNQATQVGFTGRVTWTVTFRDASRYTYVCDPHSGAMRGTFTVGGGPPPQPSCSGVPPAGPLR